jgi:hypothetical protein
MTSSPSTVFRTERSSRFVPKSHPERRSGTLFLWISTACVILQRPWNISHALPQHALSVAAERYTFVSIDHPYDADIVGLPSGTNVTAVDINDDELEDALITRVEDVAFLVTSQTVSPMHRHNGGLPKIAIIKYSFGRAAAAMASQQLSCIRRGLNIDGTLLGPILKTGVDRPFTLIGHQTRRRERILLGRPYGCCWKAGRWESRSKGQRITVFLSCFSSRQFLVSKRDCEPMLNKS